MRLNCSSNNKAFSLLELVISVAVLAVGITIILQAFSFSARISGLSCDIINAVFLAEDKIQELEFKERQKLINKEPPEVKDKQGKFEWAYNLNLDTDLNLYALNLVVSWQRFNGKESLVLNTYLRE